MAPPASGAAMSKLGHEQVLAFVSASFRSAWPLELLCLLRADRNRSHAPDDLVRKLCASTLVIEQSVTALVAMGVVAVGPDGAVRYEAPDSDEPVIAAVADLYRHSPDTVRRAIARGNSRSLAAFADAFRLRSDN